MPLIHVDTEPADVGPAVEMLLNAGRRSRRRACAPGEHLPASQ